MSRREEVERAVATFLRALGHEERGELEGTPARVAAAWIDEFLEGEGRDAAAILREGAIVNDGPSSIVVVRDLSLATMCPHHLLPGFGRATIAYASRGKIAGFGTLSTVVDVCSRRMALQETVGQDVANALLAGLDAEGAACRLELVHTCFVARGERQIGTSVETFAFAGSFQTTHRKEATLALMGSDKAKE